MKNVGVFERAGAIKALVFSFVSLLFVGCATYQGEVQNARHLMQKGEAQAAAQELKPLAEKEGKDQLVYLFDYGTALQMAGDYKASKNIFLEADKMSDLKDYISITKQAASVLLNEEQTMYKGEFYEKVLVNAMLAIDYLMLGQFDDAMVEARRINEKLDHYRIDGEKKYTQNEFAVYLTALLYEADGEWDDAYISYQKTYKLNPGIPYLEADLVRSAQKAQRYDDLKAWKKKFQKKEELIWKNPNYGELVVLVEQGWGPRKYPNPEWPRIPKLFPVSSYIKKARVTIDGKESEDSQVIHSVEKVAVKTLNDEYAALIAKRMAAFAAKEVVADQIRQKNEGLGFLAEIFLHASDRADLRQWSTLPATYQVARIFLPAGKHQINIVGLNSANIVSTQSAGSQEVEIKPKKKTFLFWRSLE